MQRSVSNNLRYKLSLCVLVKVYKLFNDVQVKTPSVHKSTAIKINLNTKLLINIKVFVYKLFKLSQVVSNHIEDIFTGWTPRGKLGSNNTVMK